jgi:transposase
MARLTRQGSSRRTAQSPAKFSKRYTRVEEMPVVHRHAGGIDLAGAASHFVAVEIGQDIEVREFGGTTAEVQEMVAYMVDHQVTTVAMEATGVYWMVVYDLLETAGIEVYLVNPTHVKNVPGRRKDDKLDCRWLQKLHKYGLLSASFRPNPEDRPLQSFVSQRTRLIQLAADEMRRMQKALDIMNVRIHKALSDVGGVTGMAIIRAIVAGERAPAVLAQYRDARCACTPQELEAALTGHYVPHQVVALKLALARYDQLGQQVVELDTLIEGVLRGLIPLGEEALDADLADHPGPAPTGKHAPTFAVTRLVELVLGQDATALDGIGPVSALCLLGLLGRDFSKWATDKHFTSHLTLAPVPKISGGKLMSSRTHPGTHPAAVIFKQAAAAVTRTDTALGAYYRRLAVRVGRGKALTATARKIAVKYYYLMKEGRAYLDIGAHADDERYRRQQIAQLTKRATKLGLTVSAAA